MNRVLLLSGGIESVTLLYVQAVSPQLHALWIDYGQRAAAQERRAVEWHCMQVAVPLQTLDLAAVGHAFRAGQTQKLHVPLPHRNLIALSLGLSYATQIQAQELYLALNEEDAHTYASASRAFIDQYQTLAKTFGDIIVAVPFITSSKADIIRLGQKLKVDYAHTYSCLLGGIRHCGRCPQCQKRRAAFHAAGIAEASDFYRS